MQREHVNFNGATVLITGGSGSWGNELTKQLLEKYSPKEIIIYSRGELAQVLMQRKFSSVKNIRYVIGDVRDYPRMLEVMRGVDYVFHMAALKHVPICEEHPWESVQTNIEGTENVIKAAIACDVKLVADVSTDKACNPINVYGSCKSVGERLIIQANKKSKNTRFACVRAGNVMGTNGSVIPFFKGLLKEGKPLPITHMEMTRYFMTLPEAIALLFKAIESCHGGEIYVTRMPACKIVDLAAVLSKHYGRELNLVDIGIRPGEKLHEELISEYESPRSVEDANFRIVLPEGNILEKTYEGYQKMKDLKYTSNDSLMNHEEIHAMLERGGFLND